MAIIGLCFPYVQKDTSLGNILFFFALCCILGMIYIHYFIKETKGLTLELVTKMYASK